MQKVNAAYVVRTGVYNSAFTYVSNVMHTRIWKCLPLDTRFPTVQRLVVVTFTQLVETRTTGTRS